MSNEVKIFIIDDHPIVAEGIGRLLEREPTFKICGHCDSAKSAVDEVKAAQPELVILDITLQTQSGIEVLKNLKVHFQHLPVLILSMHDESLYAQRALRAGASGYLMKTDAAENLMKAIKSILNGTIYLSQKMASRMLQQALTGTKETSSSLANLTDKELQVFELIGRGLGTREIAEAMYLSPKTIESYRENIKDKLNLKTGNDLKREAIKWVENNYLPA